MSAFITDFIHDDNHWWIAYPEGWLRIDDPELMHFPSTRQERFARGM